MSPEAEMHEAVRSLRLNYGFEKLIAVQRDGFLELQILVLPEAMRGKGRGSRFMTEFCAEADRFGQVLAAYPDSHDPAMKARLKLWYQRYGFVESEDDGPYRGRHVRMPRTGTVA
jgi:GNAT superfamily N-acetyltransferase